MLRRLLKKRNIGGEEFTIAKLILANIARRTSPLFWCYRGLNRAHWRLWRNSVKAAASVRKRFSMLASELESQGNVATARDIRNILLSKH